MPKAKVVPKAEVKPPEPKVETAVLVKIVFEGNVNGFKIVDELKMRAGSTKEAREIFSSWVAKNAGIKGDSGVFHPLFGYGDIKIKDIKELHVYTKGRKDDSETPGETPDATHNES